MARWRLAANLRRQDWAAVVIDLAIVVVGVFLGIQASNWNDARKDKRLEQLYLDRIQGDVSYDLRGLRAREIFWRQSAEAGDAALRFAEEGKLDGDQWKTLLDFFGAGEIWNYAPSDGSYREMLSSGRLDLLRDSRIKTELSAYYIGRQTQAHALFEVLPAYRDDIRAAIPYRFQRHILDRCLGGVAASFRARDCPPPPDTTGLAELNHSLAVNQKLIGDLRTWMTTLRYTREVGAEDQKNAKDLIAMIAKEKR